MVLLPSLTAIRFSGADAGDFLHNQLSSDVLALSPDESTFACYCEPKGRVLALMLVSRHHDDYLVILADSLAATIAKRLQMYVIRAKVDIEVLDGFSVVGIHADIGIEAQPGKLAVLAIPNSSNSFLLTSDIDAVDSSKTRQEEWKLAELRAGAVWLKPETSGQFLPQMLGFDQLGAVNYRKGCYPGQEIVARIHYLGKVKRHPRLVCTSATICPAPLDVIQLLSQGQSHKAVVTDYAQTEDAGACLFVVTRMDPELVAERIEYQGQEVGLV
jgi:folate-binding protein YgfZ